MAYNNMELINIIINDADHKQVLSLSSSQERNKEHYSLHDRSLLNEFGNNNYDDTYLSKETKKLRVNELAQKYNVDHKRLMRKIDLYLIPSFALLVFISFLNKSSFGLILMSGITTSYNIDLLQFSGCFAAFYAPYCIFQFFSNYILKKVRAHFWIAFSVLFYGAICFASGFAQTFGGFIACQCLHGLFQAGSETAVYYILAHYYSQKEAQRRFSSIYSASCIGGMVSSLIDYGCTAHLQGKNGYESWRWLLIIEGCITMFSAFIIFFTLPDFPEGARFLNDDEAIFLVKKLEIYTGKSGYNLEFSLKETLKVVIDPLVWLPGVICFCFAFVVIGLTNIDPLFISMIGYTGLEAKRRAIYPWILAFAWSNLCSWVSDFYQIRFPVILTNISLIEIGGILIAVDFNIQIHDRLKYAASFIFFAGGYAALPILLCWSSLNLGGHLRKSIGIAMTIALSSLGGLTSYYAFISNKPEYKQGVIVGLTLTSLSIVLTCVYFGYLYRENKKKRTSQFKEKFEQLSQRDKIILGDKSPNFDYMY